MPEGYFRTWVERYHVDDWTWKIPHVDSPDGGMNGFPPIEARPAARASSCRKCAITAPIRPAPRSVPWAQPSKRPMAWCLWTRSIASAAATASRPAPTAAASLHPDKHTAEKCTLCYHRITKG